MRSYRFILKKSGKKGKRNRLTASGVVPIVADLKPATHNSGYPPQRLPETDGFSQQLKKGVGVSGARPASN